MIIVVVFHCQLRVNGLAIFIAALASEFPPAVCFQKIPDGLLNRSVRFYERDAGTGQCRKRSTVVHICTAGKLENRRN